MLAVTAGTGLRFGEISALWVGDVDLDRGTIRAVNTRAWDARVDSQRRSFPPSARFSRHKEGDDQQNPGQVSETAMRLHPAHPEVVFGG
jgi:integrase